MVQTLPNTLTNILTNILTNTNGTWEQKPQQPEEIPDIVDIIYSLGTGSNLPHQTDLVIME